MENEVENVLIDLSAIALFEMRADELILSSSIEELEGFVSSIDQPFFVFDDEFLKARYFYTLGNCYSTIFRYHYHEWYSENLSKAVINYRKALYVIKNIEYPNVNHLALRSRIETNLANYLSGQGRAICAIKHWDNALEIDNNPVAIIWKANNALFISDWLYDKYHSHYHYFEAYKLICLGISSLDSLDEEHKQAYSKEGKFYNFKAWFEKKFVDYDFGLIENYQEEYNSRKQKTYLKWCADNRLFLNDLNDLYKTELVYTDCFTLPSFTQTINRALSHHEDLIYHGNFDEIKNDYCYARYLIFSAINIPNEQEHFFNETYDKVDDMAHSLTNLKSQHYKSAFKSLYSIFDKIAYFLNSFYDLNDVDSKIYFHTIFGKMKEGILKPHAALRESKNCFIHALFYILKDVRNANPRDLISKSESYWIDPDIEAFTEIRNAMEHRSLKIVDDFGHTLTKSDIEFHDRYLEEMQVERSTLQGKLEKVYANIKKAKDSQDSPLKLELEKEKDNINLEVAKLDKKINEKNKRSIHSLIITEKEFESRLFTLMDLVRSSVMYLSLAINFEEKMKPKEANTIFMPLDVPLK